MQAVVKTPHIEINIQGDIIPTKLLSLLKEEYGNKLRFTGQEDNGKRSMYLQRTGIKR